jgi:hypothetical protein
MEANLYDEFGNYIGPELEEEDEVEKEDYMEFQPTESQENGNGGPSSTALTVHGKTSSGM